MTFSGGARPIDEATGPRVELRLGATTVPIDAVPADLVLGWLLSSEKANWGIAVTPNLYHLRLASQSQEVATRYTNAQFSLADGWPVAWLASRVSGRPVGRVVGADLFAALIGQRGGGRSLVLVGGSSGPELDQLMRQCAMNDWHVSWEPAPRDEVDDPVRRARLIDRIAVLGTGGVVVLGIGAPRQEALAEEVATRPGGGAIVCFGMSINFSSGIARRAPRIIRLLRLEWLYRALQEPRRLLLRYTKDGLVLPKFVWMNRPKRELLPE